MFENTINRSLLLVFLLIPISVVSEPAESVFSDVEYSNNFGLKVKADQKVSVLKSWRIVCNPAPGSCRMSKDAVDKNGTPRLEVSFSQLPQPQTIAGVPHIALLEVYTPLDVVLTAGVRVGFEEEYQIQFDYQRCRPDGCMTRAPLTQKFVDELLSDNRMKIGFRSLNHGMIDLTLSLAGSSKAYKSLGNL